MMQALIPCIPDITRDRCGAPSAYRILRNRHPVTQDAVSAANRITRERCTRSRCIPDIARDRRGAPSAHRILRNCGRLSVRFRSA
jgi:hypothetical protein